MTSDTCGHMSALPLMRYDLNSLSWRTCEATSLWDLRMSSPTFPESGMMSDGVLFELLRPERPTVAHDFSSLLPTPHAGLGERGRDGVYPNPRGQQDLQHALAYLPTPTVMDMGRGRTPQEWEDWKQAMKASHGNGNGHGASLTQEALSLGESISQPLGAGKASLAAHPNQQLQGTTDKTDCLLSLLSG